MVGMSMLAQAWPELSAPLASTATAPSSATPARSTARPGSRPSSMPRYTAANTPSTKSCSVTT